MNDTALETAELFRQRIMSRSVEERFVIGTRMFEAARDMVLASLRADLPPAELERQLFERLNRQPAPF